MNFQQERFTSAMADAEREPETAAAPAAKAAAAPECEPDTVTEAAASSYVNISGDDFPAEAIHVSDGRMQEKPSRGHDAPAVVMHIQIPKPNLASESSPKPRYDAELNDLQSYAIPKSQVSKTTDIMCRNAFQAKAIHISDGRNQKRA